MSEGSTPAPSPDPASGATSATPGQQGPPPPGWDAAPGHAPPGQPGSGGHPVAGPPPGYGQPGGGPPPGYGQPASGPPPGYGPPQGYPQPAVAPSGVKLAGGVWWSLLAIVAIALAVSLFEDGDNGWGRIGVWAGFAIAAAVVTLAPALGEQLNLSAERAWQLAVAGGVGLAAFWVLFVLPSISQNVSFLATVGCAAGGLAAWLAPGRAGTASSGQTW